MPEPAKPALETLIGEAVLALEQGGEPALQQFLLAHQAEARSVHQGLEQLRRLGILAPPPPAPLERTTFGDFHVVRRLGMGGMGVVYVAEQQSLHRTVALKVVRPELLIAPSARERFRREVDAVARLQHPGVVPILAVGGDDDQPWFAMEFVAGRTLETLLGSLQGKDPTRATGGVLKAALEADDSASALFSHSYWETCTRLVHQVALTMCYVHERGVVHRDLKPSNLIVTPQGQVKVLDFGLAHVRDLARVTRERQPMGSPAYAAPEQLLGEAVDERVDVYALGVTLYELLTTRLPFVDSSPQLLEQRILAGASKGVRAFNPSVPRDLEIVCALAMDRDRARRYRSMAALAADLDAVLTKRPIQARPLGPGLRLWRALQRHPVWAIGIGAAALVALQFPLLLWRQQARANVELAASNHQLELANASLTAANLAVAQREQEAESRLQQALGAIETMLSGTTRDYSIALPSSERMQLDLAARAAQLFAALRADLPHEAHIDARAALAAAVHGDLLAKSGEPDRAEPMLREAIARLAATAAADDRNTYVTALRALAGAELRLQRPADAERTLQQALCATEQQLARTPTGFEVRRGRAAVLAELARLRLATGDGSGALALLQEAQVLLDTVAAVAPGDPLLTYDSAVNRELLLQVLPALDPDQAGPVCERAIADMLRVIGAGHPGEPYRSLLASLYELRGSIAVAGSDLPAAAADFWRSLALRLELLHEFPTRLDNRYFTGASWFNLAMIAGQDGQHAEALARLDLAQPYLREARAASPDPRYASAYTMAIVWRVEFATQLGRHDEKAAAILELGSTTDDPAMLLAAARMACVHLGTLGSAPTDTAAAWRPRAVLWVTKAIAAGFRDADHFVRGDQAHFYDPIRAEPGFAAAMRDLEDSK